MMARSCRSTSAILSHVPLSDRTRWPGAYPQAGQIDDLARGVAEGAADATGLPSTQTAVGLRVEGHHHVTRRDLLDRLFGAVRQEDGSVGKETMDVVSRIGVGIILDDSLDETYQAVQAP